MIISLEELASRPFNGERLLFTTDWHVRVRAPKRRVDDYRQAVLDKLQWCIDAGNKLNAHPVMICGGDMFDAAYPNLDVADDVIDLFDNNSWKIASVLGNHDLDGAISSAPRTVLGHLMRRNCISLLPILENSPMHLGIFDLWAMHWQYLNHENPLHVTRDLDRVAVIAAHSMILKEDAVFDEYKLYKDLDVNSDVLLLGHYHPTQELTRLSNPDMTIVSAPGALMRGALSASDLSRMPMMTVIEATSPTDVACYYVPIEVALPGKQVFSVDALNNEKQAEKDLESFISNLSFDSSKSLNVASIIEEISRQKNVSKEVKDEALSRLGVIVL